MRLKHYLKRMVQKNDRQIRKNSQDAYAVHFNTPIKFYQDDWFVNERIVELPFVHNALPEEGRGKRILEFGCTRSDLCLQLAAQGYDTYGIDLREYPFHHPKLRFHRGDLLQFQAPAFDYIVSVSVLEHVGLGTYDEKKSKTALENVAAKLGTLLKPGGRLIITVPCGQAYQDHFLRSFPPTVVLELFQRLQLMLVRANYFIRQENRHWFPSSEQAMAKISNTPDTRGPTGVNGLGCYVWEKQSS